MGPETPDDPANPIYPSMAVLPEHRDLILARLDAEITGDIYDRIVEDATAEYEAHDTSEWDHKAHGHNATTAQANALLAWLHDDPEAGAKATDFLLQLPDDFETNTTWDVNIRMPEPLMGYTNTLDLLLATDYITSDQADAAEATLTTVTSKFYDRFVVNDGTRQVTLGFSQNNHPIRTATAIGYVALAFPHHPDAQQWLDWAVSELDYLWGPNGQYVQPDGVVSEGTHYYGFAFAPSVAFFIAMENRASPDATYTRDCVNRQDVDPWAGHGCVHGEPFTFDNPLRSPLFHATAQWSAAMRLPSGYRPPLADAYFTVFNGGAVITGFGAPEWLTWDWLENDDERPTLGTGANLSLHHLAYMNTAGAHTLPEQTSQFFPDGGAAVFRSGWDKEALWLLLLAEQGAARKTLHDHVDGTSFSMAAYGEYLLVDPGYYKPNDLNNARTSAPGSHNVILVDGVGAPDKGLLTSFGDTDASLENTVQSASFVYAEAHQSYEEVDIERSVTLVNDRYFVVSDRITSGVDQAREFTWRSHGNAGYEAGGSFEIFDQGATWERDKAGVDVYLTSTDGLITFVEPSFSENHSPHIHEFDRQRAVGHHAVMDGVVTARSPGLLAILAPYPVEDGLPSKALPIDVSAIDAGDGQAAWSVTTPQGTDAVFQRSPDASFDLILPTGEVLSTDGELVVLTEDGSAVLLARGSYVSLDGTFIGDLDSGPVSVWEAAK